MTNLRLNRDADPFAHFVAIVQRVCGPTASVLKDDMRGRVVVRLGGFADAQEEVFEGGQYADWAKTEMRLRLLAEKGGITCGS